MHLFHKWKYYQSYYVNCFMGKSVNVPWDEFRKCRVCEKVQQVQDSGQGRYWRTLMPEELVIFNKHYKIGEEGDKLEAEKG